jgi:rRNA processing protein Gar1
MPNTGPSDLPPLGSVLRVAPDERLLVESNGQPPEPGQRCQTQDGRPAGVVDDVIGPVDGPLLVVALSRGPEREDTTPEELVGSRLYAR